MDTIKSEPPRFQLNRWMDHGQRRYVMRQILHGTPYLAELTDQPHVRGTIGVEQEDGSASVIFDSDRDCPGNGRLTLQEMAGLIESAMLGMGAQAAHLRPVRSSLVWVIPALIGLMMAVTFFFLALGGAK